MRGFSRQTRLGRQRFRFQDYKFAPSLTNIDGEVVDLAISWNAREGSRTIWIPILSFLGLLCRLTQDSAPSLSTLSTLPQEQFGPMPRSPIDMPREATLKNMNEINGSSASVPSFLRQSGSGSGRNLNSK